MKTQCPNCLAVFSVPDNYLGKTGRCDKCQGVFPISEFRQQKTQNDDANVSKNSKEKSKVSESDNSLKLLERLYDLKEKGALTEEEFQREKTRVLNSSSASDKETNPVTKQNVSQNIETAEHSRGVPSKPRMPEVIKAGLAMCITSCVLGFAIGFINGSLNPPEVSEDTAVGLIGIGCFSLILASAGIVGLIMACLGRAWGAILMTCTNAIGVVLTLPPLATALMWTDFWVNPFLILVNILGIASSVCFLVPSAWAYYKQSDAYRKSKYVVLIS